MCPGLRLAAGRLPLLEDPRGGRRGGAREESRRSCALENRASGKHVTVVDGLPDNREFLDTLCRELKKACGTGGAAGEDAIELQGDQRERLRELLAKKGMPVKG